jgi:hypothetical protein
MCEAKLYGIYHSNRKAKDFWSKNRFNSCFPIALCCYMRDKKKKPIYLFVDEENIVKQKEIPFETVFNTDKPNSELEFLFESNFKPYKDFSSRQIGNIDVIIKEHQTNVFLRPLEIKLTAVPDSSTARKQETDWAPELVVRPATTSYLSLGVISKFRKDSKLKEEAQEIFNPVGEGFAKWFNSSDVKPKLPSFHKACQQFHQKCHHIQTPFLLQPIWKTKGQTPLLEDNALDVFVWSDLALAQLFLDMSFRSTQNGISRPERETVRYFYTLFEGLTERNIDVETIYREMNYGIESGQSDKAFAANGNVTSKYLRCARLQTPIIKKSEIKNIILNGGEKKLQPERRLDQTIFFTMQTTSNT